MIYLTCFTFKTRKKTPQKSDNICNFWESLPFQLKSIAFDMCLSKIKDINI